MLSKGQVHVELKLAREAYVRGDAVAAIEKIDVVLESNPDCGQAHFGKGAILAAQERHSEALSSFIQALRYNPEDGEALKFATLASLELRQSEQAEAFARRMIQVQPKNDRAYFLLSVALNRSGRWNHALEAIERSLAIQPLEPDYVVGKAQLLARLHFQSLAIEWYRKALAIRPAPQIAKELAEVLMEESRVQDALLLLEQFAPELPLPAQPHVLLGRAYTESQQFKEAEQHWILADKYSTDPSGWVEVRAKSEIWGGRLDVAEELLREALERDPNATSLYSLLATITKATDDMQLIQNMERLLTDGDLNSSARQDLHYALGKSYHDLGDYGEAIEYYDEANRLRDENTSSRTKFDPVFWRANIDFQINFFTKERVKELGREGLESKKPLFIVGMIRSGTTLSEQILNCHSKIQDGGENSFWVEHRGEILDPRSGSLNMETAKRTGRAYLASLGSDAEYVIDKNPSNVMFAAALHCLYPNARLIHVKRHAVDNLLSIWMTPIKNGLHFISRREDLVFVYREYLRLARHMEEVLPEDRFRTFGYEEITSNPVPTIESMLRFLDLEAEPNCFHPEKNRRVVRTPSVYQVRQPINTDSQARWRQYEPWLGAFAELLSERT